MAESLEIIGGPTLIPIPPDGGIYRFKVQNGRAEQHVYVQIASSLRSEAFDEPIRSGIETKGESVLLKLLERGTVRRGSRSPRPGSQKSAWTAVRAPASSRRARTHKLSQEQPARSGRPRGCSHQHSGIYT